MPLTQNVQYSAFVSSNPAQPLAAVMNQYSGNVYLSYNLFSNGSTLAYAPLIMNKYYYWVTSVNVQNLSNNTANVTVQYIDTNGNNQINPISRTIPAHQTRTYYSPNERETAPPYRYLPDNFIGTAKITSDQQIVVTVNQSYPFNSTAVRGMSYSGAQSGSNFVLLNDVVNNDGNQLLISSINVKNLSDYSTTVTLVLRTESACQNPFYTTIQPRGYLLFYSPNCWPGRTFRTSGYIIASDGRQISVVVNHASNSQPNVDFATSYNGINR